jgi:hypothetical protein
MKERKKHGPHLPKDPQICGDHLGHCIHKRLEYRCMWQCCDCGVTQLDTRWRELGYEQDSDNFPVQGDLDGEAIA